MVETKNLVREIAAKYGHSKESLLPILQEIVCRNRYITDNDIVDIANVLDLSAAEIYGTASFFTYLDTEKRGKFVIRVCRSIIAVMKGKQEIINAISDMLKIKVGETTPDGMFTLLETNDIGWSDQEPSMLINDDVFTNLTPEKTVEIIKSYMLG